MAIRVLDKAEYSAFESTLNSLLSYRIVSYRHVVLQGFRQRLKSKKQIVHICRHQAVAWINAELTGMLRSRRQRWSLRRQSTNRRSTRWQL